MRKSVFALIAVGAVVLALIYAIVLIPEAVRAGVADALPEVADRYEQSIMDVIREEMGSEQMMVYIQDALTAGVTDMRSELSTAVQGVFEEDFSGLLSNNPEFAEALIDRIALEVAGNMPDEAELSAMAERIVRDEVSAQLNGLTLDQDTFTRIISNWLTQRLSP